MSRHAALVALQADADAARFDQVGDAAAQAEGVARDARRIAAQRHQAVVHVGAGGDIVVARQAMLVHRRLERGTVEAARDLGEASGHAGMRGLEDHDVDRLQGAEFLGPAPGDAEFVMVDHHVGRQQPHAW